ncbi:MULTISPECIES: Ku protein [unclassified Streptomyces]|uniref:non-homologous end joining protein Ku n=1 Tax=unclassified Streptomyces TaxID=2593676 RepID=UPI002366282C|nr:MULTISPECIES: Ku protein [unclassified Streptomyces]MDF3141815.1 Ku protein [Streptomyces sp. T21Q-yed]WDF45104.1 Ku protein [Streptomyces sp. T12]
MPSIWTGAISFGLVSIPIGVVSATEDHSVHFRRIHLADMGLVRNRYICEAEDREVTYGQIGKGYELPDGRVIPVTDEELRRMPLPTARAIELTGFVSAASIDPVRISQGYYLQPQGPVAAKPYVLLRKALARTSKVGIARFAWHDRERLGLLRVRGDAIVLHAMLWPDEVRDPSQVAPKAVQLSDDEIAAAVQLIDAMTREELDQGEFRDHYTEAVREVIDAKREGQAPPEAPAPQTRPVQVMDLMRALQESVAKAKASRGETAAELAEPLRKKTAVKKTAKKAPARKTTKATGRTPRGA